MAVKEKKIELANRDLIVLFAFFVIVLIIVFIIGLLIGRNLAEEIPQLAGPPTPLRPAGPPAVAPVTTIHEVNRPPAGPSPAPSSAPTGDRGSDRPALPETRSTSAPPAAPQPADAKPVEPKPVEPKPVEPKPAEPKPAEPKPVGPKPTPPPATRPAAPAPSPADEPAPAGQTVYFIVQTMASPNLDEARQMVAALKARGYDAFVIMPRADDPDRLFRVQAGKFRNLQNARDLVTRLQKDGYSAFPRRIYE